MNRMKLIGVALCVVLLTTVGVDAVAPQPKLPPPYRVVQYDVIYQDKVVGKLSINTNKWTYILNAHGLQLDTEYYFYYLGKFPYISNETANENGDLHMQGAWDLPKIDAMGIPELSPPEFILTTAPMSGFNIGATLWAKFRFSPVAMTVWGNLCDEWNNHPLANQKIKVMRWSVIKGHYVTWDYVYTDSNGNFEITGGAIMRATPPYVVTVSDPAFDFCRPTCCLFVNNGEEYNCVGTCAELDF